MVRFSSTILKFADKGEKTGWNYIPISGNIAGKLKPGSKKSFRVKGKLDQHPIQGIALLPMGDGNFIMALNADIRRAIKKGKGASILVSLEVDDKVIRPPTALMECLKDSPVALAFFKSLPCSHQNYFGTWIKSAKTKETQARRIAKAIMALEKKAHFGQMMQSIKAEKNKGLNKHSRLDRY